MVLSYSNKQGVLLMYKKTDEVTVGGNLFDCTALAALVIAYTLFFAEVITFVFRMYPI